MRLVVSSITSRFFGSGSSGLGYTEGETMDALSGHLKAAMTGLARGRVSPAASVGWFGMV